MASLNKAIDKQALKGLSPLGKLTPDKIDDIISKSRVENLPTGRIIFRQGEDDGQTIYLLSGQVEYTTAGKTRKKVIKGKSVEAKFPLADDVPRSVTARTKTASSLLYIDSSLLEILLDENTSGEYEVTEINVAAHATDWMMRFLQSRAFLKLPTTNIQKVLMSMEEVHAQKGETIIRQGDDGDYYYILKDGSCTVSRHPTAKSEEIRLAKLTEGDGFGEEALITNCKRNASVTMQEKGTLMRLKKDDFLSLLVTPLIRNVHLNSLKANLYSNSIILDIRTANEFKKGSLDKAKHIPLSMMRIRIPTLDAKKQYLVYADNKDDARAVSFLLAQHGIDSLVVLGTIQHNLPIIQPPVHTIQSIPDTTTPKIEPVSVESEPSPQSIDKVPDNNTQPTSSTTISASDDTIDNSQPAPDTAKIFREKIQQETQQLRLQAQKDAAQMLAEAEAIRQSAISDAARLRDKIEKEETLKLRSELEDTRSRAEAAIKKSEELAAQIRQQAEQESSQIRQQAMTEAELLRKELAQLREQETQMKQKLEDELVSLRQQATDQARLKAEQEAEDARIVALHAAEQARTTALREAENARITAERQAEQTRLAAEQARSTAQQEAEKTRAEAKLQARQSRLAAEQARNTALREAEETRIAAERAATLARAEADRLTQEAHAIEKAAEQARKTAEQEAEAIRRAAIAEAEAIKNNAIRASKQKMQTASASSKSFISHENVFNLDEDMSPTIQPVLPYADEASMALKMAKEIKARLLEVEEQRIANEQNASNLKHKKADVRYIDGKIILESEEDIFIFKEPKKKYLDNTVSVTAEAVTTPVYDGNNTNTPAPFNPEKDLPSSTIKPNQDNIFELTVEQRYEIPEEVAKNKKSLMAIAASILLIITLSLAAYTTKIQINFTEVDALVNQESVEAREQKVKEQARQDFRNKLSSINHQ